MSSLDFYRSHESFPANKTGTLLTCLIVVGLFQEGSRRAPPAGGAAETHFGMMAASYLILVTRVKHFLWSYY